MPLKFTRAIIDGIHSGQMASASVVREPIMGLENVTECEGVPAEMMQPSLSWRNTVAFEEASRRLAARFRTNFEKFAHAVDASVISSGPASS
jgi:phosphoenolpyruvate carboxykinase (ATP)